MSLILTWVSFQQCLARPQYEKIFLMFACSSREGLNDWGEWGSPKSSVQEHNRIKVQPQYNRN